MHTRTYMHTRTTHTYIHTTHTYMHTHKASALIQSQEDQKVKLLYKFLADASEIYSTVFPLM